MPTRYRDVLSATASNELTLTKHPEGCVMIFPRPLWMSFCERIEDLPMAASGWRRIFLGNAQDVEIDGSGRLLVAPELRAWAGITDIENRAAVLIGLGGYFELWDAKRHADHEAAVISTPMPDALKDFRF